MMTDLPKPIKDLAEEFAKLPSIGRKSAERFVFYLLQKQQKELDDFSEKIKNLKTNITRCAVCGCIAEQNPCLICADGNREQSTICVVVETRNIILIEKTKTYNGKYHVLGGLIDTAKKIMPENLNINSLINRLQKNNVKEIIFALNPNFEGERTILYLQKITAHLNIKTTRLARGLPSGAEIEYADESTLAEAIRHRF
ncbi:recombination protein RecR [Candidatus Falkowbacteria bacterium CG10_big_fil_rev_8_21_14_0_10_37_6]|uniref:Recombination protein RecR n=1 Tax=Candidatus Falkowbacteria bacterium CG10_big_fil_rev_8_21_14_0_10_37_6 TaxID=1974563 RepID=A0A2H0V6Y9_9BACT|nr:MAG: recombination protein RecR [Candidatus Falkowbacteria bacterium CG10_big_fil_rev_8_21_14_0_10_37_6]